MSKSLVVIAGLVAVGCSGGADDDGTSGPDAGGDGDASNPTAGLRIEIEADPERGPFGGDFNPTLDDIEIVLSDLRAIGDAAPGDERTRIDLLTLRFSDDESVRFDDAPVGRYSRIRARVDRFFTRGTCVIDSETLTWEIDVSPPGGVEIDISLSTPVELEPAGEATIELEIELDKPYDEINWDQLTPDGDTIRIDDSSDDADEVYSKIREAFDANDES